MPTVAHAGKRPWPEALTAKDKRRAKKAQPLLAEPAPDPAAQSRAKAIEESRDLKGMSLEEAAVYLAGSSDSRLHGNPESKLPPFPTQAKPGTATKLRVMRVRAKFGYALFHPQDAR